MGHTGRKISKERKVKSGRVQAPAFFCSAIFEFGSSGDSLLNSKIGMAGCALCAWCRKLCFRSNSDVRISLPLGASLDSGDLELALRVVAALKVAEGERFELSESFRPRRFSRPVHSATLPPLRDGEQFYWKMDCSQPQIGYKSRIACKALL
jgi:hypothetical protein